MPSRIEAFEIRIALTLPIHGGVTAWACDRHLEKEDEQFIWATPIGAPAQFIVDEPAENVSFLAPLSAKRLGVALGMPFKVRIEDVGKK